MKRHADPAVREIEKVIRQVFMSAAEFMVRRVRGKGLCILGKKSHENFLTTLIFKPFIFSPPVGRIVLSDEDGNGKAVRIGTEGEPMVDPEGNARPRRYVSIEGEASVYLVGERVLSVVKDLVREGNRKAKKDAEKAARRERIPSDAPEEAAP